MTHRPIDWNDLQYVLAVAQAGSLAGAARRLGVTHSTVLRRVAAFEAARGVRLFDRLPGGYALTSAGEEMLAAAREVADTVTELERRLDGRDLRLEGVLRVTTTDTLMVSLLPPILAAFGREHPGVTLDLSVGTSIADLARREADVAIRASSAPADTLVGRRIAAIAFAVYAAPEVIADAQPRWVGTGDALSGSVAARWLGTRRAPGDLVLRADTMVGMAAAASAGVGLTPLPCYLGDRWPGLVRAESQPIADMPANELWVLTHADLRRTARVRAFTEFVGAALANERDVIEGRAPGATSS